jgi:PIN domain nuclease of toxin-antitoxin system
MILIDSHILLWRVDRTIRRLDDSVEAILDDPDLRVVVSAASLWELAIKANKGKLKLPDSFRDKIDVAGFEVLPVTAEHALAVAALPKLHGDPFDRMLVAQAKLERLTLMTRDARLAQYGVAIQLV